MSRNRSNFVRVMGTASAVVLSSTLAMPAVAIAADTDGAELTEQSVEYAESEAEVVKQAIQAIPNNPLTNEASVLHARSEAQRYYNLFKDDSVVTSTYHGNVIDSDNWLEWYLGKDNIAKLEDAELQLEIAKQYIQDSEDFIINEDGTGLPEASEIKQVDSATEDLVREAVDRVAVIDGYPEQFLKDHDLSNQARNKVKEVVKKYNALTEKASEQLAPTNDGVDAFLAKIDIDAVYKADKGSQTKTIAQESLNSANATRELARRNPLLANLIQEADWVESEIVAANDALEAAKADKVIADYELEKEIAAVKEDEDAYSSDDLKTALENVKLAKAALDAANEQVASANQLLDELSTEQQRWVNHGLQITEIQNAIDNNQAQNFIHKALYLPEPPQFATSFEETLDLGDEDMVNYVRGLYDSLSKAQKDEVQKDSRGVGLLDKLVKAEEYIKSLKDAQEKADAAAADRAAAEAVSNEIKELPSFTDLVSDDAAKVNEVLDAYNALTDAQKELIAPSLVEKLNGAKTIVDKLAPAPVPVVNAKVFRLYNPNSGEHFYTAEVEEKDALVTMGWADETSDTNAWTSADETGTPVYRLYNPNAKGGDHHFTTSTAEVEALVKAGWVKDNGGKPVFYGADAESGVAIYRAYNGNEDAHNHNYTPDKAEQDALVAIGWADEGIAFYGAPLLKDAE